MKNNIIHDQERFLDGIKKAYFLFSRRLDGSVISVSSSVTNLLGYDCREFAHIFPDFLLVKCLQSTVDDNGRSCIDTRQQNEFEIQVNHKNGTTHWLKIIEIPVTNDAGEIKAFDCIAHDITNHKIHRAELLASEKMLRNALGKSIRALAATVESRDYFSYGHHERASSMARLIAQELGISDQRTDTLRLAGVIHDIGKISVPTEILNKRTHLSDTEYGFVHSHPETGYNILKSIDLAWPLAEIVLQHHERMDGSGYPFHLSGDAILPESRILAVADVIEAMASDRAHRPALELDTIMDELSEQRGILFDPDVVDVSMRLLAERKIIL